MGGRQALSHGVTARPQMFAAGGRSGPTASVRLLHCRACSADSSSLASSWRRPASGPSHGGVRRPSSVATNPGLPTAPSHHPSHPPLVEPLAVCDARGLDPLEAARCRLRRSGVRRALSCAAEASARAPDEPAAHSERGAALSALGGSTRRGWPTPALWRWTRASRLAVRGRPPVRRQLAARVTTTSWPSSTPSGGAARRARRGRRS